MGGHKSGLFKGTSGDISQGGIIEGASTPNSASTSLSTGNTIRDNLAEAMAVVPLKKSGYFADASKHKGRKRVRVYACSNPARTASEFANKMTKNYVSLAPIEGKGYCCTMRDGSKITYRWISSSKDRSPVVELTIRNFKRVKSQKIHFVKNDTSKGGKNGNSR